MSTTIIPQWKRNSTRFLNLSSAHDTLGCGLMLTNAWETPSVLVRPNAFNPSIHSFKLMPGCVAVALDSSQLLRCSSDLGSKRTRSGLARSGARNKGQETPSRDVASLSPSSAWIGFTGWEISPVRTRISRVDGAEFEVNVNGLTCVRPTIRQKRSMRWQTLQSNDILLVYLLWIRTWDPKNAYVSLKRLWIPGLESTSSHPDSVDKDFETEVIGDIDVRGITVATTFNPNVFWGDHVDGGGDDGDATRRFVEGLRVVFFKGDRMGRWRGCGDNTDPDAVEMEVHLWHEIRELRLMGWSDYVVRKRLTDGEGETGDFL